MAFIIPLPVKQRMLPEAPGAVLDAERRPEADLSPQMRGIAEVARVRQPQLRPDALSGKYEGLDAVGRAVMQAGGVVEALAMKMAEAETELQVSEAQAFMQAEEERFEQWKVKQAGLLPSEHAAEWRRRSAAAREQLLANPKLRAAAKQQIDAGSARWVSRSQGRVETEAAKETFRRVQSVMSVQLEQAIAEQNPEKFHGTLEHGERAGYFYPDQAQAFRQKYAVVGEQKRKQARADAFDADVNNGIKIVTVTGGEIIDDYIKSLPAGRVDEAHEQILRERLRRVVEQRSATYFSEISERIASGEINSVVKLENLYGGNPFVSGAVLKEAGEMVREADRRAQALDREENGVRNAVELRQRAQAYDAKKDPSGEEYFRILAETTTRVPENMRGEITGELYRKYGGLAPKARDEITRLVGERMRVLFDPRNGTVAKWEEPVAATDAKDQGVTLWREIPGAKEKSARMETAVRQQVDDWIRANPQDAKDPVKLNQAIQDALGEGMKLEMWERIKAGPR